MAITKAEFRRRVLEEQAERRKAKARLVTDYHCTRYMEREKELRRRGYRYG